MKPQFSTLIILTLVCAALLTPFALSPIYLDMMRDRSLDLHQFVRGEWYKQGTGYTALVLVIIEMMLTARKRSRKWPLKVRIPGSVMLWRVLHVFTGVFLLAVVLLHTVGSSGLNFNAVFLWVFFGVTFTALVGVVAETGVLESPRKVFSFSGEKIVNGEAVGIGKGTLVRGMRAIWLPTHILLVSVFTLMLGFHIFLAYLFR
ncbi:MAG: hypothetical protein AAGC93_05740 [Cyanobacteria bacterium P01_F01_bin.53]